jgi:hypothetical protein
LEREKRRNAWITQCFEERQRLKQKNIFRFGKGL